MIKRVYAALKIAIRVVETKEATKRLNSQNHKIGGYFMPRKALDRDSARDRLFCQSKKATCSAGFAAFA